MTATISFLTVQTRFGKLYSLRIEGGTAKLTGSEGPVDYALYRARPSDVAWAGPKYLAKNGTAWQIGRDSTGARIAWKTVKISSKFGQAGYRMRSVPGGYKGDYVKCWARNVNGKTIDFRRILWNQGQDGMTVIAEHRGVEIHRYSYPGTVKG